MRGPGASGTRVEGLTSLEWLCGLNVDPLGFCFTVSSCCSVVACGAANPTSSTKSIPHTQHREDSTLRIILSLAGRCWDGKQIGEFGVLRTTNFN